MSAIGSRMPDLEALSTLLTVVRTGSLNSAAAELGISQQATSARIRTMEHQVGVRLLRRTAAGSVPTEAGTVVVQWADRLLGVAAEMDAGLAGLRHERRSRLKLAASLTVAEQLLPRWLVSFAAAHARRHGSRPAVSFTAANSEQVLAAVRAQSVELGFVEGPRIPRGLRTRVVAHDQLVVIVPFGHPWTRRRRPVDAAELAATALVAREPGSGTREFLDQALDAALGTDRVRTPPSLELSTTTAVRAAVIAGAAPAAVSALSVVGAAELGVTSVPVTGLDLRRPLRAVWLGERTPPAGLARDLLAHIRDA